MEWNCTDRKKHSRITFWQYYALRAFSPPTSQHSCATNGNDVSETFFYPKELDINAFYFLPGICTYNSKKKKKSMHGYKIRAWLCMSLFLTSSTLSFGDLPFYFSVFPKWLINFLLYTTCVNWKIPELLLCNVSIFMCRKKNFLKGYRI